MPIYGAIPRGAYRQLPRQQPRSLAFERYALGFNGINNYVSVPAAATELDFTTENFTFEIILKWNSGAGRVYLVDRGVPNVDGYYFRINADGTLVAATSSPVFNWTATTPGDVPDQKWCKIDIVRSGADINFLKNAVVLVRTTVGVHADPLTANRTFEIGRLRTGLNYFKDCMALFRAYNIALTPDELRWNLLNYHNPVRPGNLVLWLPMEEGTGLVATDHSGLGNNGALLPALTPPTWERVRQYELRAETE